MKSELDYDPSAEFGGLDFEQIRQIAAADRDHAYGIDEQALAAVALNKMVGEVIEDLRIGFEKVNQPTLLKATDELMKAGTKAAKESAGDPAARMGAEMMVFQGQSARAAITQLIELGERSRVGGQRISSQPDTLTVLAGQVRRTDTEMSALAEDRQRYLDLVKTDPASPELLKIPGVQPGMEPSTVTLAITMDYNTRAREKMQASVNGYFEQASRLESPQAYEGPRVPAPAPAGRQRGGGDYSPNGGHYGSGGYSDYGSGGYSSPGPQLNRDLPAGTTSTDYRPSGVDVGGYGSQTTGPELTGPAGPGPTLSVPHAPVPPPPPMQPPVFGIGNPGGYFVPNQPVTRPVFGTRPIQSYGTTRPMLRPNTSGLVRPVIGERPGKSVNAFGRPQRPVVRPIDSRTLGGPRADRLAGRGLPPRTIAADPRATGQTRGGQGRVRPPTPRIAGADGKVIGQTRNGQAGVKPPTPRIAGANGRAIGQTRDGQTGIRPRTADGRVIGQTRSDRPGVRALSPRGHTADGRVIRVKLPSTSVPQVERAEFSREPRLTHGGNDNSDSAALRNSRPLSATPTPALRDAGSMPASTGERPEIDGTVPPVIRGARGETAPLEHDPGHYVTPHNLGKRL